MKKLLAVILVLGMASLAHADLVLSVDGLVAPDEIWILPSQTIEIDVQIADGHDLLGVTAEVRVSNGQGELLLESEIYYPDIGWMFPIYTMNFDSGVIQFTGGNFGAATAGPTVIMEGLLFHCLESTDVIIDLHITGSTTQDGVTTPVSTIEDSIIVHQIPEPMTVALLGLGGMFLLRRRK